MPLTDANIADMITTTLHDLGRGSITQLAQELAEYYVLPRMLRSGGNVRIKSEGIGLKETLMTSMGGESRWVGLNEEDVYNWEDILTQLTVVWTRLNDNMMWERRMLLENRGEARVNNVIKPQRVAMWLRIATALEAGYFGTPDATDTKKPWGLKYWLTKNATTGFNGGLPSGFTTKGGVNITTYPAFKNYTFQYTNVTKADVIKKMRTAHRKTNWRSPYKVSEISSEFGARRQIFMNEETISAFEDLGEAQNENLGRDLAPFDDMISFKKHPLIYIPYLDADTTNPIYMNDIDTIYPVILKGDNLRESDAHSLVPIKHNTFAVDMDLSIQFICSNPRANVVGYV
ncbi:MAG: phage major capsid protein [Planctomycetes bacterium]|nr:phage major capsid protein [Chloroflexota bacterium]MBE3144990.1 phage major capsid protein [Planctomycetota bacterium]